jgi:cytochrome c oxidase cbb3-type subunit IV
MDINLIRTAVTVLSFIVFIGIVWWALSKSNKRRFEEAAMLPFADDEHTVPTKTSPAEQP